MTNRPRLLSSTPLLVVADLQRAIDFYRRGLGFGEPSVWGEPPCFAMLNRNGLEFMLSVAAGPAQPRPNGPSGTWDVYLRVADVAAEMAALAAGGVTLAKGPTDTVYDMREIEVVDPDGYRICLGQDTTWANAVAWHGVLDVGARKLRLVLHVATAANGALCAQLDSLDQNALGMAVDVIARQGDELRFDMKAIGATFAGRLDAQGAVVTGQWSQGGRTWPLVLTRS